MANYSKRSRSNLDTCHPDLIKIGEFVIRYFDHSIIEGHRTLELQNKYFNEGKSKIDGIIKKGKHNYLPSKAFDAYPYPIPDLVNFTDKDRARFYTMAGYMFMAAEILYERGEITHKLRWGGDWDRDGDFKDQGFDDLPHYELYKPR